MKKFILKIFLFVFSFSISVLLIMMYWGVFKITDKLNFVSNSISFNCKSAYLLKNKIKLNDANYVILGSSMSLNNIDGEYLEKITKDKIINLSSWGMKISDFKELLAYVNPKSKIIINISFTDFGKSSIEKYLNFPICGQNEYLNKIFHFTNFKTQVKQIEQFVNDSLHKDYTCLNFDKTGSVMLFQNNFNISSQRWDDSHIAPSKADMDNFITQLGLLKNHTVYVFFSPERLKYKSKIKRRILSDLDKNIKRNFNNVCFFNNYNQDYSDSKFVDCHHFNNIGARDYSKLIFNQLESKKSN